MTVIGITRTKGKTTTAYMIYHILEQSLQRGLSGRLKLYRRKENTGEKYITGIRKYTEIFKGDGSAEM